MSAAHHEADAPAASRVSLLFVATVSPTIRQFLIPYAIHFRGLGWRVDAAANGVSTDSRLLAAIDDAYELPLSRSILDLGGLVRGERAFAKVLRCDPDIVHVHTPIAAFIARFAIRRLPREQRPLVAYTAHGFHFHKGGGRLTNLAFLTMERLAGRWTDRLVVINDEDEQAARDHRIVPSTRLVRMPGIGVDTEAYARSRVSQGTVAEARRVLGLGPEAPYFVVVGELSQRKRPFDVVEALSLMRHTEVKLVLAGDGPGRDRLVALIEALGLGDRVILAGLVQDVRPIVSDSLGLVLASDREGLPRAILEALSIEVPVIASTARGNAELVEPDGGFIFPTGDVAQLAEKMDWLVEHPDEGAQMGRNGRARMIDRYDISRLLRLHDEMYAELLASRGKPNP